MRHGRWAVGLLTCGLVAITACSLFTNLDGLHSGGPTPDGATPDAGDANAPPNPTSCGDAAPQSWTSIPPGPLPSRDQAAIFWTGTDYLVFGGTEWGAPVSEPEVLADGGTPTVADGGWALGCAVGWVGYTCSDGARFSPATQTWTRISNVNSPMPFRWDMSWAFGNGKLFTYSGHGVTTGGWTYDVASDTWKQVSGANAPTVRAYHASYFVNGKFFLWGGESLDAADASVPYGTPLASGAYYDPVADQWTATNPSVGFAGTAYYATASSDTAFFVWGGTSDVTPWIDVVQNVTNTGAVYDYATNTWKPTSTVGAPSPRMFAAAVWTGSKFVVYGGVGANKAFNYGDGSMYDPATDTWTAISAVNAPTALFPHTMLWTGKRVLIWGNEANADGGTVGASGAIFDPEANAWDGPITQVNAPPFATNMYAGYQNTWNGSQMLMWGGLTTDAGGWGYPSAGALYSPPCAP